MAGTTELLRILSDAEIDQIPLNVFFRALREYLAADAEGEAVSPSRYYAQFPTGSIALTVGGNREVAGFRAYETFNSAARTANEQVVVVWDQATCRLKGIAIGQRLGAIRTGVLGGIAVDMMAPKDATTCAIVGAGLQAETQLAAIASIRKLSTVRVYSRNPTSRAAFSARMSSVCEVEVRPVETAEECVQGAEIVVLATDSSSPVIETEWVSSIAHVNTVGPKLSDGHELPIALALRAETIASDSPQQIASQAARHMLYGTPSYERFVHLGKISANLRSRGSQCNTLYLSAGLAGSEVVALNAAMRFYDEA